MQAIESLDLAALFFFSTHRVEELNPLLLGITQIGDWYVLLPLALAMIWALRAWRGARTAGIFMIAALLTWGLCYATQMAVGRPRPDVAYAILPKPTVPSFPSGHTMNSVLIFGLFGVLWTRRMPVGALRVGLCVLAFVFPLLIGFSRLYLTVHYVSDVIGGWLGGLAVLFLALSFDKGANPEVGNSGSPVTVTAHGPG